ncbi:MAG: hypothetical protein LIO65_07265, partial [Odoribacter sp.]|nr:hypothetical protein [Odoribacter sp.]
GTACIYRISFSTQGCVSIVEVFSIDCINTGESEEISLFPTFTFIVFRRISQINYFFILQNYEKSIWYYQFFK